MVPRYRKKEADGYEIFAWLLAIGFTLTIGLIVEIFKLLAMLIKWIISLFKERNSKSSYNKSNVNSTINQSIIKPKKINYYIDKGPITTYEDEIVKVPDRIVKTPYDEKFKQHIRLRGINYFDNKKVSNYILEGQICSANIIGIDNYKTSITFYKNKNIKKAICTCPYYEKENEYCKHIYALLLEYCSNEKIGGYVNMDTYKEMNRSVAKTDNNFYNRMLGICNSMKEILNNTKEFYDSCKLKDGVITKEIYNKILVYESKIDLYENTKLMELNEELIEIARNDLCELENLYENLSFKHEEVFFGDFENTRLKQEKMFYKDATPYHLINGNQKKKEQEAIGKENEKLKDIWGLSTDEIELVKNGDYEPYQFDEEELEEDDYYYEDD